MKILIDPMVAVLAKDLSVEEKATLLMCILEYPNRDCELGLWKYMKQQIDMDAKKYREKCERIFSNSSKKSNPKSTPISESKSDTISSVKKVVSKDNINKDNYYNVSVSSNKSEIVNNSVNNFLISNNFSFDNLCKTIPKLSEYLSTYVPAVIARAEKTIIKKRAGQKLSLAEILDWINQESIFYKQNHGGKL